MATDPQAIYVQLGRLLEAPPNLSASPRSEEGHRWLGRAYALIIELRDVALLASLDMAIRNLESPNANIHHQAKEEVFTLLHRALAIAELRAPVAAQGAFIPAGGAFDALAAIGKVLASAKSEALIIDPYMDETVLTDFAPMIREGVQIKLLSDQHDHKASLKPAVERWRAQHKTTRPLEARLALARTLHDRLIVVDTRNVHILTQSLNAFAARAPASIVRVDDETANLKIVAYDSIWMGAASF
jgi:hypothetical protein